MASPRSSNDRSSGGPFEVHTTEDRRVAVDHDDCAHVPFGPPRRTFSFPVVTIRRLYEKLSKLSPAAFAEREMLKEMNRCKRPLTERNVDHFVEDQLFRDACYPDRHSTEIQVAAWLERLP